MIAKLSKDQVIRAKLDAETLSITIYNSTEKSHTNVDGSFMWSQLYLETLLRMPQRPFAKDELVQICRQHYHGNESELIKLENFHQTYTPNDAVKWYTKDCFIYRSLNKALRVQDIDLLFAFGFMILDIFNQLKLENNRFHYTTGETIIRCYRGQAIAKEELNQVKSNIGHFISMNSFLSTTQDRTVALIFAPTSNEIYEKVLFEIQVDMNLMQTMPFADVAHLSYFDQEKEILFMCGAIFQIKNVINNETEGLWIVQLALCSETSNELKDLFDYQKQRMADTTDLISIGKLLREMGKFDKAKRYYQRFLCELSYNDPNISVCYYGLGVVHDREDNYDEALHYFKKALDFQLTVLFLNDSVFIGKIYGSSGIVYYHKHEYDLALEHFEKSLNILLRTIGQDHGDTALIYTNIGRTYQAQKSYDLALENQSKALAIRLKVLPPDHPRLARSYLFIGDVYGDKQEFQLSLINYKKALKIQQKSLPENYIAIGITFHRIGRMSTNAREYQSALESYILNFILSN
ncbi:unnamed protein product [Didymodactylos carnosus]|uniref:Uncharacterized protein n=1 Tax=Didymodactylos carnosus TaxID=1234261 RepID=A0A8S2FPS3_9BILA|nr:unnamed protein product [Didymodactylos carnosus]CAF4315157.1 unnamed protein product [Didymodactylos carnosus]